MLARVMSRALADKSSKMGRSLWRHAAETARAQSSTIVYEIEPGGHLGWHTDATEETQYIIAGTGELLMDDGTHRRRARQRVRAADGCAARPRQYWHRRRCARVAFFAAAMFTQTFDEIMLPPNTQCLERPIGRGEHSPDIIYRSECVQLDVDLLRQGRRAVRGRICRLRLAQRAAAALSVQEAELQTSPPPLPPIRASGRMLRRLRIWASHRASTEAAGPRVS